MTLLSFYKALADDTRLKTLLLLSAEQELCVCELMVALNLSQPKISRHLALLKEANLVHSRRQGTWVFYSLSASLEPWQQQLLSSKLDHNLAVINDNLMTLNAMGDRPERITTCCV
ncbi:metalloregulator ArsR/SmtB family transcription factor [Psychrobium sp. 1_MG-2023]|uniref:ArsR/SmtB family transcription factor n=1 Tax=Psychrobium sp. 1_MG-2023 TaxID=3062624 RepID=UPI000C336DAE|nr:metalloregulator ArsR/SmtB family transcription factor [Psychrobium sp. 1_MG-2023]MDP2562413.1 metalloregulator ArsR/SmtB family transcription factor [Psychrobium sp. 1_MG-2023]PKF56142.1 transcriptional regulator [Alteromonadales bacterium alter-6D02]